MSARKLAFVAIVSFLLCLQLGRPGAPLLAAPASCSDGSGPECASSTFCTGFWFWRDCTTFASYWSPVGGGAGRSW